MSRPLRIAYLVAALDAAGSERQMLALAEGLPRERFLPEFLLLSRAGVNANRAEASGVPVHVVPPAIRRSESDPISAGARVVRKVGAYTHLVRAGRYDIVDAWLFHAYVLAALARPVSRVPVLVTGRRSLWPREASGRSGLFLQRLAARASDSIVANSPQVRESVLRRERVAARKVRVIRNGVVVPPRVTDEGRRALRMELGLGPDMFAVGVVAHLRAEKGHEILIRALAVIAERRPDVRVVLVGDGTLRLVLERLARELGVDSLVQFAGSVLDASRLMPAFDIVAQTSLEEGLPNAMLEAAAAGRPIVATPAGGTVEVVRDGETGLLIPMNDPAALALAIDRLAGDPGLRHSLGNAARSLVEREFGMQRFVAAFADHYLELADRRGIAGR